MNSGSSEKNDERIVVNIDSELQDLVPGFIQNRHNDIGKLIRGLESKDFETIQSIGHTMKGSGGGYGFDALTEIGMSIERSAREKNMEEIREYVRALSDYLKRIDIVYV